VSTKGLGSRPRFCVTAIGVQSTAVAPVDDCYSLADLQKKFGRPVLLTTTASAYSAMSKKQRTAIKRELPYFVGGYIKGKRHDDNVVSRTVLTLDIEAKDGQDQPPSFSEAVDALQELKAEGWIYTSISHTEKAPRYRVVLPLSKPITGDDLAEALKASTLAAAEKLGLKDWCTPESWVLSQPMFLPVKLKGGIFNREYLDGKQWRTAKATEPNEVPEPETKDLVLNAIKKAGLYLRPGKKPGMHFIDCPFKDHHGAENDTQTVYYEPHFDGNPRAALKCFDTEPDEDGQPHLTYASLCTWLREKGFLDHIAKTGELPDPEQFLQNASLGALLDTEPEEREFAIENFCPVGKVTVLAGPGGVSKSMLVLHASIYGAMKLEFGPFKFARTLRTLFISYEDDRLELHRRVAGLSQAMDERDGGLTDMLYDINSSVRKNLFVYPADDDAVDWLLMRNVERYEPAQETAMVRWLADFVREHEIKLLVLDPAVYTHTLEETNPGDMAQYMRMLNRLAKQGECAVLLVHHMQKAALWAAIDEVNQGSLRGASSFADNARSVGVVVSVPIKDAMTYGLPAEPATSEKFAVFKHVKHNYSGGLGIHFFERRGPLLIPRSNIERLEDAVVADNKAEATKRRSSEKRELKAIQAMRYIKANDRVSTNIIRLQVFNDDPSTTQYLRHAETQGWIENMSEGQRHEWSITVDGKQRLKAQPSKPSKPSKDTE
jgi:RecA-family ATPase